MITWIRCCVLFLLISANSSAQPYVTYGGTGQDQPFDIKLINDELIIVGSAFNGSFPDILDGFVLTVSKDLDSLYFTYHLDSTDTEYYTSIVSANNGNYTCGGKANYCCDTGTVAVLTRLNSAYAIDTVFHFGGSRNDLLHDVLSLNNYLYLFGYTQSHTTESAGANGSDPYVVKCDLNGNMIWEKHPGTMHFEDIYDSKFASDQNFLCVGGSATQSGADPYYDGYAVKLDTAGEVVWRKTFKTGFQRSEYFYAVTATPDGGGIAAGYAYDHATEGEAPYFVRFDTDGDTVWTKVLYHFNEDDNSVYNKRWRESEVWDVLQLSTGDFLFTGDWYNVDSFTRDIFICKYNAQGDSLWRIDLGDGWSDKGYSAVEDDDGFIYVAGSYANPNTANGLQDVLLIKLDANGCTVDTCLITDIYQPVSSQPSVLKLYPNPIEDVLHVELNDPSSQRGNELFIRDASGRTVIHQGVSNSTTISVKALTPGVYIAELKHRNGQRHFQRLVKL